MSSTAQTVYVVSTKDSLGFDVERVFSNLDASKVYGAKQHNITEWSRAATNIWVGKANGVEVCIHKKSVYQGAMWT